MSLCGGCEHAEYHGYPPKGSPEWEVGTVYFWCPWHESHEKRDECEFHSEGRPRMFDKRGRYMG